LRTTYSCRLYHLARSGRRTPPVILVSVFVLRPAYVKRSATTTPFLSIQNSRCDDVDSFPLDHATEAARLSGRRPGRRCTNVLPRGRSTAPTNRSSRSHRADRKRTDRNHIIRGPHAPAGSAPGVSARGRLVVQARPTAYVYTVCICVTVCKRTRTVRMSRPAHEAVSVGAGRETGVGENYP
jgi:hypothetical protein